MLRHYIKVQMNHFVSKQQLTAASVNDGPSAHNAGRYAICVLQRIAELLKGYVLIILHHCFFNQCLP